MDSREWGRDAAFLKKPVLGALLSVFVFSESSLPGSEMELGATAVLLPVDNHNSPLRSTGGERVTVKLEMLSS